jgi:general secretion pathway protein M
MKNVWKRMSTREQRLVLVLSIFLLGVTAYNLIWQPTRQRLQAVERQYHQQLALATQLHIAQPRNSITVTANQPLSLRLSESAAAAGLEIHQMETDDDQLRLTLSGEAKVLMQWLDSVEHEGVVLQSLTLEKRDTVLEARVVFR